MKIRTTRFAIVIEKTEAGHVAYVPDLPGCAVEGKTVGFVQHAIRNVVQLELTQMRAHGMAVPQPSSQVGYVEIPEQLLNA
jgi:predicted RNase H-like HicB family nuclease